MIKNNLTKELVSRSNQISFFKYIGILPNPDTLFLQYGKNYQTYRDLKIDSHLWACIQSRKAGVIAHKHSLLQANASNDVFDFIQSNMKNIDIEQLIRQMLEAVFMGFQAFEIVWQPVYINGKILYSIKKIEARPQEYFYFDMKGNLKLNSSKRPYLNNGSSLPKYKILLVRHEADYENPYGQPLLGKCYWACTFKNTAMRFWVNFIEKFGLPTIIASTENTMAESEAQNLMDTLIQMQDQNTIVASGNINIGLHENNKTGNVALYSELINICNAEISKVILSETLTTEIDTGSYAAAKTHQEVRKDVVKLDLSLIEKNINMLISYICELNFGDVPKPVWKHTEIDS